MVDGVDVLHATTLLERCPMITKCWMGTLECCPLFYPVSSIWHEIISWIGRMPHLVAAEFFSLLKNQNCCVH